MINKFFNTHYSVAEPGFYFGGRCSLTKYTPFINHGGGGGGGGYAILQIMT